jgi:hypothetical protein
LKWKEGNLWNSIGMNPLRISPLHEMFSHEILFLFFEALNVVDMVAWTLKDSN